MPEPDRIAAPSGARFPTGMTVAAVLAVGRWLCWLWMVVIVVVAGARSVDPSTLGADDTSGADSALRYPALAWLAVVALLAVTVWATASIRRRSDAVLSPRFAAVEITLALVLSSVDGLLFDPGHVFATSQSLATQYPVIAVASAGLAFGPWVAAGLGALMGPAEWWAAVLNDFDDWAPRHTLSIVASSIYFAAIGALLGWLGIVLRRVERQIADQRARDEVADVLHDTVLQTLALVEQRSITTDPELAAAARRADDELRSYLFGTVATATDGLESAVHSTVDAVRSRLDLDRNVKVIVNVLDQGLEGSSAAVDAVVAALGEAVSNALQHAAASRVVVFVETDGDGNLTASIRDDGRGFDVDTALDGDRRGLRHSIIGRMRTAGGVARIESTPDGTSVLISTTPGADR